MLYIEILLLDVIPTKIIYKFEINYNL